VKRLAMLLLLSVLVLGDAPLAEAQDVIGMYADLAGTINQINVDIDTPFNVYVLLKNPSSTSNIIARDCFINYPDVAIGGNVIVISWAIAGGGTNTMTEPEFQVAMLDVPPLVNDDIILLLSAEVYVTTTDEAAVYIDGSTLDPLGTGQPTYCPEDWGEDPGNLVEMTQSSGDPDIPVFTINPEPVPVASEAWSAIKALYR
jgi:hypothetical protein